MQNEVQFFVKYNSKVFMLVYKVGIFSSLILSVGLLCSFRWLQKWMHFVLIFENLKPFSVAHLLTLLMLCCSFLSRVGIYLNL